MPNDFATYPSLAGKRVVMTGGASGIGAEIVAAYAAQGAHVGFLDIDADAGAAMAARHQNATHVACDLRDIDALQGYWDVFPEMRASLFEELRPDYRKTVVPAAEVKATILNHPEFVDFAEKSLKPFTQWAKDVAFKDIPFGADEAQLPELPVYQPHTAIKPKTIIHCIGEALLQSYIHAPLLSRYDIYQILMDYWSEVMQDDVYILTQDGWSAGKQLRELVAKKGEKLRETQDLIINKAKYKAELIPPALIVSRYYQAQQTELEQLQAELDNHTQALESYLEEHSGDEGLLGEALNDKDKVTKVSITARLKLASDKDEIAALKHAKKLFDAETKAKKDIKEAETELDLATFQHYATLSEDDIKTLVVEDKWLAALESSIKAEIERVTQQLANRVKELEERYAEPLPAITDSVEALSDKVAQHLKAMGLEWSA